MYFLPWHFLTLYSCDSSFQGTDILLVLDNVTFEDWGADTADIWGLAIMIRERLLENHEPGDEVEEESYVSWYRVIFLVCYSPSFQVLMWVDLVL